MMVMSFENFLPFIVTDESAFLILSISAKGFVTELLVSAYESFECAPDFYSYLLELTICIDMLSFPPIVTNDGVSCTYSRLLLCVPGRVAAFVRGW